MQPNDFRIGRFAHPISSGINLIAGTWFFISPWIYHVAWTRSAWNAWIIGFIIACAALERLGNPQGSASPSRMNAVLGIWIALSPWVFGYSQELGRMLNSLCVGILILAFSIVASTDRRPYDHGHQVPQ
jgi:hypothetical protein